MDGILDDPASALYADPTAAQGAAAQQQQQGGLFGLLAAISRMRQQEPLGQQAAGQQGYSIPQISPQTQAPVTPQDPRQAPGFAPPIQPRVPTFDAVAKIRQQLGLPPLPMPQQAPAQQPANSPASSLVNPSLLALYG